MNKSDSDRRTVGAPLHIRQATGGAPQLVCAALILSLSMLMFRIALIW
jgi:hypothetical protein